MNRRTKIIAALILGAGLVLMLAAGWPFAAHYRAKWRVEEYKRQLRAGGEKLAIAELTPSLPVADIGAARTLMDATAGLSGPSPPRNFIPLMRSVAPGHAIVAWKQEILPTQETTNVWPGLSAMIRENEDALAKVRVAMRNPTRASKLAYGQGFALLMPHLTRLKGLAQWLSAATILELHEGRAGNAWGNLKALTALVDRDKGEALMISELVRIAIGSIAVTTAWEALQLRDWREADLRELQTAWESVEFVAQAETAISMERAMGEKSFEAGRQSFSVITGGGLTSGGTSSGLAELTQMAQEVMDNPRAGFQNIVHRYPGYWGWKWWGSYEDELANAEMAQASLETLRAAKRDHVLGARLKQLAEKTRLLHQRHQSAGDWLGYSLAGETGLPRFLSRVASMETQRSLLVTAIALKRYQISKGAYPADLNSLLPEFVREMPRDVVDGQPLRYRVNADGSFLLYSIGEDGQDNGGDASQPEQTSQALEAFRKVWWRARDAVWPWPASAEEVKAEFEKVASGRKVVETAGGANPASRGEVEAFRKRYGLTPGARGQTNAARPTIR